MYTKKNCPTQLFKTLMGVNSARLVSNHVERVKKISLETFIESKNRITFINETAFV